MKNYLGEKAQSAIICGSALTGQIGLTLRCLLPAVDPAAFALTPLARLSPPLRRCVAGYNGQIGIVVLSACPVRRARFLFERQCRAGLQILRRRFCSNLMDCWTVVVNAEGVT
jgi:hypothetical protein